LRWVEAGSGDPVVVLESGMGEPGTLAFAAVIPEIAERVRVIAYDRAGVGSSDPNPTLTVRSQVDDLAAVVAAAGAPCVLAGHSWGGLLVQLMAVRAPDLIAGLVLIDPADEIYWSQLPAEIRELSTETGDMVLEQQAAGTIDAVVRDFFSSYAESLTEDEGVRELLLSAYRSCYSTKAQAQMVRDEALLFNDCVPEIHQLRCSAPLPDVPAVVLSATTGADPAHRARWTAAQVQLAKSMAQGTHIELPDTHHAINEFRPKAIVAAIGQVLDAAR
jgi:pimeloyl-ACP methyl ester carboxylesterase